MSFWATATLDLRLSSEEFFDLTPRQFDVLCKRYQNTRERDREHPEFMLAQLTSWVANTGFRSTEKPTKTADFMPSTWIRTRATPKQQKSIRMTKKRRKAVANAFRCLFPPR